MDISYAMLLHIPHQGSSEFSRSFSYLVTIIYNELSQNLNELSSNVFKHKIEEYLSSLSNTKRYIKNNIHCQATRECTYISHEHYINSLYLIYFSL